MADAGMGKGTSCVLDAGEGEESRLGAVCGGRAVCCFSVSGTSSDRWAVEK
jgi:hypothetical protein